jgi:hypothetical protein
MADGASWLVLALAAPVVAITWAVAYRLGTADGRESLSLELVEDLAKHGLRCEQRSAAEVARRLQSELGLSAGEAARIVRRAYACDAGDPGSPARRAS